jgi:hypothetical protein
MPNTHTLNPFLLEKEKPLGKRKTARIYYFFEKNPVE